MFIRSQNHVVNIFRTWDCRGCCKAANRVIESITYIYTWVGKLMWIQRLTYTTVAFFFLG